MKSSYVLVNYIISSDKIDLVLCLTHNICAQVVIIVELFRWSNIKGLWLF